MKAVYITPLVLLTVLTLGTLGTALQVHATEIDYLGADLPGWTPQLFAPGVFSTGLSEYCAPQFSPDGLEVLYHVADSNQHVILRLRKVEGRWGTPEVVPFSGSYSDELPVYSPGGDTIYFRSRRPLTPAGNPMPDFHSWRVSKDGDDWGDPQRYREFDLCTITSFARDGTLYCSAAVEGRGGHDLFRAELRNGVYDTPVSLGDSVNTSGDEISPQVAPDESCVLYQASGGPRGSGPFVSFRSDDGAWSAGRRLSDAYDSHLRDRFAAFSPDGRYIFFVGWRFDWRNSHYVGRETPLRWEEILYRLRGPENLRYDVYWIGASILEPLRPERRTEITGDYLGQAPPGLTPEVFAPGVVSTGVHEHSAANFAPDGNELFFVATGAVHHTLIRMERRSDGNWTHPQVADFSGRFPDDCPSYTADGERLYFQSRRPRDGGRGQDEDWGVWYVEKSRGSWSDPMLDSVLTELHPITPTYARNGNVYFARRGPDRRDNENGTDLPDIYVVEPLPDGSYTEPRSLGPNVNSDGYELWLFIHPDEEYLVFTSYGRPTGDGLYVSFRDEDGGWLPARWLGHDVNSGIQARMARLSPDGRYLFYNRLTNSYPDRSQKPLTFDDLIARTMGPQNSPADIWWVDTAVLERAAAIQHPDIHQALLHAIEQEGVEAATDLYNELKRQHPDYYDFAESLLDNLGSTLLGEGKTEEAITVLKLNVELFPSSARPYDSLARAHMDAGHDAAATSACRQALTIEPTLASSIRMLRTLEGR